MLVVSGGSVGVGFGVGVVDGGGHVSLLPSSYNGLGGDNYEDGCCNCFPEPLCLFMMLYS